MNLLRELVDLVLPSSCAGCGEPGRALCRRCTPAGPPLTLEVAGLPVAAAGRYEDGLRSAILAYKERGRRDAAGPLGQLLARAVAGVMAAAGGEPAAVLLLPVPSSRAARAARGGDTLRRLALLAAPLVGLRVGVDVLHLRRTPLDSAGLGASERARNLAGAMAARPPGRQRRVVIVDDVVTSGATVGEAARALRESGWVALAAAAVAHTPKRSPARHAGRAALRGSDWQGPGSGLA